MAEQYFDDVEKAPISVQLTGSAITNSTTNFAKREETKYALSQGMLGAVGTLLNHVVKVKYNNRKMETQQKVLDASNQYQNYINSNPQLMNTPEGLQQIEKQRKVFEDSSNQAIQDAGLEESDTNTMYYASKNSFESKQADLMAKANMIQYTNAKSSHENNLTTRMQYTADSYMKNWEQVKSNGVMNTQDFYSLKDIKKSLDLDQSFGINPIVSQNNVDSDLYNMVYDPIENQKKNLDTEISNKTLTKDEYINKLIALKQGFYTKDKKGNVVLSPIMDGILKQSALATQVNNAGLDIDTRVKNIETTLINKARDMDRYISSTTLSINNDTKIARNYSEQAKNVIERDTNAKVTKAIDSNPHMNKNDISEITGIDPNNKIFLADNISKFYDTESGTGYYTVNEADFKGIEQQATTDFGAQTDYASFQDFKTMYNSYNNLDTNITRRLQHDHPSMNFDHSHAESSTYLKYLDHEKKVRGLQSLSNFKSYEEIAKNESELIQLNKWLVSRGMTPSDSSYNTLIEYAYIEDQLSNKQDLNKYTTFGGIRQKLQGSKFDSLARYDARSSLARADNGGQVYKLGSYLNGASDPQPYSVKKESVQQLARSSSAVQLLKDRGFSRYLPVNAFNNGYYTKGDLYKTTLANMKKQHATKEEIKRFEDLEIGKVRKDSNVSWNLISGNGLDNSSTAISSNIQKAKDNSKATKSLIDQKLKSIDYLDDNVKVLVGHNLENVAGFTKMKPAEQKIHVNEAIDKAVRDHSEIEEALNKENEALNKTSDKGTYDFGDLELPVTHAQKQNLLSESIYKNTLGKLQVITSDPDFYQALLIKMQNRPAETLGTTIGIAGTLSTGSPMLSGKTAISTALKKTGTVLIGETGTNFIFDNADKIDEFLSPIPGYAKGRLWYQTKRDSLVHSFNYSRKLNYSLANDSWFQERQKLHPSERVSSMDIAKNLANYKIAVDIAGTTTDKEGNFVSSKTVHPLIELDRLEKERDKYLEANDPQIVSSVTKLFNTVDDATSLTPDEREDQNMDSLREFYDKSGVDIIKSQRLTYSKLSITENLQRQLNLIGGTESDKHLEFKKINTTYFESRLVNPFKGGDE